MGKRLHLNPAAEQEATDIGRRFMNSTDVVGDMSRAYGADLSSVRIHTDESAARRTAERGVDAYSTGKDVFFAQGAFDKSDPASRGLLAHELSHSLQQGVGGDMGGLTQSAPMGAEQGGVISWFRKVFGKKKAPEEPNPEDQLRFTTLDESTKVEDFARFVGAMNRVDQRADIMDPRRRGLGDYLKERVGDESRYGNSYGEKELLSPKGDVLIEGLYSNRLVSELEGAEGGDMSKEEIGDLYEKLLGGGRYQQLKTRKASMPGEFTPEDQEELDSYTPERLEGLQGQFDAGMMQLKGMQLAQLRRLKEKYGLYGTQMHLEDFVARSGRDLYDDFSGVQSFAQMMKSGGKYFDFENNADDREYRDLTNYYFHVIGAIIRYSGIQMEAMAPGIDFAPSEDDIQYYVKHSNQEESAKLEKAAKEQGAKGFTTKQQKGYKNRLRKRFDKGGKLHRLFGRFL